MIEINPEKRLKIDDVLNSKWIKVIIILMIILIANHF